METTENQVITIEEYKALEQKYNSILTESFIIDKPDFTLSYIEPREHNVDNEQLIEDFYVVDTYKNRTLVRSQSVPVSVLEQKFSE